MGFLRRLERRKQREQQGELLLVAITFFNDDWSLLRGVSIVCIPPSTRLPQDMAQAACDQAWRTRCNPGGSALCRGPFTGDKAASIPQSHWHRLLSPMEAHALDEQLDAGGALAPQPKPGDLTCSCCARTPGPAVTS